MSAVLKEPLPRADAFPPINASPDAPASHRSLPVAATPDQLIAVAMAQNVDLDRLERLFVMKKEWEQDEARKAFAEAFVQFKLNSPVILKDAHVHFENKDGTVTDYNHPSIGHVCERIIVRLAEHGIAHRWIPGIEGELRTVTCRLTHRLGHFEDTTLRAGLDQSGGKNNIQAMASTNTYLERHSLLAATGLAPKNMPDDDGRSSEAKAESLDVHWIKKVNACKTPEKLNETRKAAGTACNAVPDVKAWNAVKAAVAARLEVLKTPPAQRNPPEEA